MTPLSLELPARIETSRLYLRSWQESDVDDLLAFHAESADQLHKWYGGILSKPHLSQEDALSYIRQAMASFYTRSSIEYPAFDKKSDELVGAGSLHHLDWSVPKARIGYLVRATQGGKGLATELANIMTRLAFEKLSLNRLEIRAATGNPASHKIPRKLGYEYLCVFEKNKKASDGALWDLEIHARFNAKDLPEIDGLKWHAG